MVKHFGLNGKKSGVNGNGLPLKGNGKFEISTIYLALERFYEKFYFAFIFLAARCVSAWHRLFP